MIAFDSLFAGWDILRPILLVAVLGAFAVALTAASPTRRAVAWGVGFACWFGALCTGPNLWDSPFATVVTYALLAVPAVALVWASWTLPRGRRDTVTAEIGLLALIVLAQQIMAFTHTFDFTLESVPVEILVYYLFLAAAFAAAAIPVPTRRIAYGAAALACALIGIFREVLLYSQGTQHPDVPFNDDILVAAVFVGIPLIGTLAQIAWWAQRRKRTDR